MHVKCAVFDNNVILTGANLSEDYFVDRQDRYWIFNDNEKLCDYYEDLVGTLISNSHQVAPSGDCEPRVRTQLSNNSLKFSLEKQMKIFEMAYSLDDEEKASLGKFLAEDLSNEAAKSPKGDTTEKATVNSEVAEISKQSTDLVSDVTAHNQNLDLAKQL
jgi:hypothetical protein